MGKVIRSVHEALLRFAPDHEYWDSARLNVECADRPTIEHFYRHPEWLDYRWVFTYRLTKQCAIALVQRGLVEPDSRGDKIFQLSKSEPKDVPNT
jgi:hypothetical protein